MSLSSISTLMRVFWHQISLLFIGNYQCYIRAFTLIHFLVSFINKTTMQCCIPFKVRHWIRFAGVQFSAEVLTVFYTSFSANICLTGIKVGELFNAFYLHKNVIFSINCVRVMSYTHISLKPGLTFSKLQIQLHGGFTWTFYVWNSDFPCWI